MRQDPPESPRTEAATIVDTTRLSEGCARNTALTCPAAAAGMPDLAYASIATDLPRPPSRIHLDPSAS